MGLVIGQQHAKQACESFLYFKKYLALSSQIVNQFFGNISFSCTLSMMSLFSVKHHWQPMENLTIRDNYNLLFIGPPASSKTLFLEGILNIRKGVYFDGSNTTSRILDLLEEEGPKSFV